MREQLLQLALKMLYFALLLLVDIKLDGNLNEQNRTL